MATMADDQIERVYRQFMENKSRRREPISIKKQDIKAAVVGLDAEFEAQKVTFNNALPPAARAGLSASDKAELGSLTLLERYAVGA